MEKNKAIFINAWPYQKDKMNLPVRNLESSISFYENVMGFKIFNNKDLPYKTLMLRRDAVEIGLAENGGDPTQDGCFFEVDNVHSALDEMKAKGMDPKTELQTQKHGDTQWKVYFVIAPDGLCYCIGERQK